MGEKKTALKKHLDKVPFEGSIKREPGNFQDGEHMELLGERYMPRVGIKSSTHHALLQYPFHMAVPELCLEG